jgi:hypothetical protein
MNPILAVVNFILLLLFSGETHIRASLEPPKPIKSELRSEASLVVLFSGKNYCERPINHGDTD